MTLPNQPKLAVAAVVAAPHPAAHGVPIRAQVDIDLLILTVSGHLSNALRWPPKQVAVVAAWLSHLNESDDDVWPGNETLAAKAKVGESTVKRAKKELRKIIGLFPIANPEGRRRNQFQHEGDKRGKLPTDAYELTPLAKMLPRGIWLKLVAAYKADKTRRRAAAAQDNQPDVSHPALVDETGLPNPLDDAAPVSTHDASISTQEGNPAHSGPPVLHATAAPSDLCNVEVERKAQKESDGPAVPTTKNQKKSAAATARETFQSPKLAHIREDGSSLPGFAAVRAFSPPMDVGQYEKIIAKFDDAWAEKLAWYVRWLPNVAPKNCARTAVGIFKRWSAEPAKHGWPGDFETWLDKHQKRVAQQAALSAQTRNAARVKVTAAPPRPESAPEAIPTAVLLRALEIERGRGRKLHERAKLTIESPPVKARAKILMNEERAR